MEESRLKEGETAHTPSNLFESILNETKLLTQLPCFPNCISWQGASQFLSHHQIRAADLFSRKLCFSLANPKLYVLSAATACHYMLGKHVTSTTNETYRHLSADLNVEMWLLHFQSVHQGKKMIWSSDWHKTYIVLALPGRPRANYDSQKNWAGSLRDWARMRTPRICMDPTNLQAD